MSGLMGYDWKMRGAILTSNIVVIGIFLACGWFLDIFFKSGHAFLFITLFISFPFNQFVSYKLIQVRYKNHPKKIQNSFDEVL